MIRDTFDGAVTILRMTFCRQTTHRQTICRPTIHRNVGQPVVFSLYCRPIVIVDEKSVDEMSVDELSPHLWWCSENSSNDILSTDNSSTDNLSTDNSPKCLSTNCLFIILSANCRSRWKVCRWNVCRRIITTPLWSKTVTIKLWLLLWKGSLILAT